MKFGILDNYCEPDIERRICEENEIISYEARSEEELPDEISELDGCLVWHFIDITEKTLKRLNKCKVIIRIGVGFDSVNIQKAGEMGIAVCNVPDYGTNDVADHCFSLLLASCRSLIAYQNALQEDIYSNWHPEIGGDIHRLTEANLGIVGFGRIGTAVARRAQAFGMNVSFYDPYLPDGYDKANQVKRFETLEELFINNEYISIHAPLNDETSRMIGMNLFNLAKKPLTLINTARGGIVVLDDVYDGLKRGVIKGFAADVLETEPPSDRYQLIQAFANKDRDIRDKVILTPHSAFYAEESRKEMREKAAMILADLYHGKMIRNCVNKEFLVNPRIEKRRLK